MDVPIDPISKVAKKSPAEPLQRFTADSDDGGVEWNMMKQIPQNMRFNGS